MVYDMIARNTTIYTAALDFEIFGLLQISHITQIITNRVSNTK